MGIQVQPFEEHHIEAVKAFNARIAAQVDELENRFGGAAHSRLPESVVPTWLPPVEGSLLREEHFVAVEGDEVRGGYTLKFQEFSYRGKVHSMAGWHEPVSEGTIEKKYAAVGMMLLRAALKAEPHLYCTAMGGIDTVPPKFLKAMHWQLELSSFQFYVHRPYRFFRGLRHLRRDRGRVPARRFQKLAHERDAPPYALHAHAEPGVALGEVEPVFVGDRPISNLASIQCNVTAWRASPFTMAQLGALRPTYCGSGPGWRLKLPIRGAATTSPWAMWSEWTFSKRSTSSSRMRTPSAGSLT